MPAPGCCILGLDEDQHETRPSCTGLCIRPGPHPVLPLLPRGSAQRLGGRGKPQMAEDVEAIYTGLEATGNQKLF